MKSDTEVHVPARSPNVGMWMMASTVAAIGFLVVGLSVWRFAMQISSAAGLGIARPGVWAIRCAGVALVAAAELLLLSLVVDQMYRRDALSTLLRRVAAVVVLGALAGGAALALVATAA